MKGSKFQLAVLLFFGLCVFGGIFAFSIYRAQSSKSKFQPVTIWGTVDGNLVRKFIGALSNNGKSFSVNYIQKNPTTFHSDLVEALALGQGPDALLVNQDQLFKERNKIVVIPYTSLPLDTYQATYVEAAETYIIPNGIVGIPLGVDPMVMYWNRDLFNNASVLYPPKTWDAIPALAQNLTLRDRTGNITQSAIGLGEANNVDHAKEIVSTLILQTSNPIILNSNGFQSTLASTNASKALNFYTQFANPSNRSYSWNKSLPSSKDLFIQNRLAIYFGFASEIRDIQAKNPNLNFDVAVMPQLNASADVPNPVKATFAKVYGFSITIASRNVANTLAILSLLTNSNAASIWAQSTGLPAVRRDAMSTDPSYPPSTVFVNSAIWSKGWADPDGINTTKIFQNMINSVTSGQTDPGSAAANAGDQIQALF